MISTSRVLLRPLSLADVPKLLVMSGEEGIRRRIPDQGLSRRAPHGAGGQRVDGVHRDGPAPRTSPYVLGIEDKETGALIGHVGLSPARGSVEIGYAIEQRLQGKGLATASCP